MAVLEKRLSEALTPERPAATADSRLDALRQRATTLERDLKEEARLREQAQEQVGPSAECCTSFCRFPRTLDAGHWMLLP